VLLRVEKEQQPAPDFALPAIGNDDVVKNGKVHLQDLKGRTTVLYFYPQISPLSRTVELNTDIF